MKPSLMVIEPKAHRRLALVAALGQHFSVLPLASIDGALRQIRNLRPRIVLIGIGRRVGPGLRLCRQIKTDAGSQSYIGLIDWRHRFEQPDQTIQESGCNGIFNGVPTDQEAIVFASELNEIKPTVHGNQRPKRRFKFL